MRAMGRVSAALWFTAAMSVVACTGTIGAMETRPEVDAGRDSPVESEAVIEVDSGHRPSFDDALFADPCNGSPILCNRRYDQVVFAAAHLAMATSAALWSSPTQHLSMREQLDGEVRVLDLEVHERDDVLRLCRGDCSQGE